MSNLNPGGLTRVLNYIKTWVTGLLNGKANSSHTHTKSQITDFPTIPTVNNATLTIQKNGTTVNSFTANASSNVTANITVPTKVSELTNDSGYITSSGSCNYANSAGSAGSATTAEAVSTSVAADSSKALVYSSMADNDFCRILVGGSSNAGYVEIATADDGNEPIYVRQYTGVFSTVTRTLTLLDGSGNTQFPGTVTAPTFSGNLTGNCSGSSGSCTGNAANVTGTVAIGHGGTGATTRLGAVQNLTNENVGTSTEYFLTITTNWGKAGYCSVANAKSVLGVPTNTNQLTNGAGFITSSGSCASCTEAAYMGQHSTITYGVNRLQYYNVSTSTTSGATSNANPTNDWYYHLLMSHANSAGYYGDIALCFHSNTLAFRRIASGGDNGWCYIVKNGRTIVSGYEVYVG